MSQESLDYDVKESAAWKTIFAEFRAGCPRVRLETRIVEAERISLKGRTKRAIAEAEIPRANHWLTKLHAHDATDLLRQKENKGTEASDTNLLLQGDMNSDGGTTSLLRQEKQAIDSDKSAMNLDSKEKNNDSGDDSDAQEQEAGDSDSSENVMDLASDQKSIDSDAQEQEADDPKYQKYLQLPLSIYETRTRKYIDGIDYEKMFEEVNRLNLSLRSSGNVGFVIRVMNQNNTRQDPKMGVLENIRRQHELAISLATKDRSDVIKDRAPLFAPYIPWLHPTLVPEPR